MFIVLLRGINVGGNKRIKMADLKVLFESIGFSSVQTLLQSGNVILESEISDSTALAHGCISDYCMAGGDMASPLRTTRFW